MDRIKSRLNEIKLSLWHVKCSNCSPSSKMSSIKLAILSSRNSFDIQVMGVRGAMGA